MAPVYLNFVPFDALLDVGSSISMIDMKVCEKLGLPINPFSCDIPHYVSVEGALMTKSLICIMGWVEVEVGILGMGCILARFWVTDCGYEPEGIIWTFGLCYGEISTCGAFPACGMEVGAFRRK